MEISESRKRLTVQETRIIKLEFSFTVRHWIITLETTHYKFGRVGALKVEENNGKENISNNDTLLKILHCLLWNYA